MTPSNWKIYLSPPHMSGEEIELVTEAIQSNWVAPLGPMVDRFEHLFAKSIGVPYAAAVSSGTAALHLGLRCLGVRQGDAVVLPTLTFVATATPILYLGGMPVFVDVCASTWTLDPALLKHALADASRSGRRVGAIVSVDLYGQPADLDSISTIAAEYGVPVLSDSAESLGAKYKEHSAGVPAHATAFSFNGNKVITTSGGGMLASADQSIIEEAKFLSQQARDPFPFYQHSILGYNYRLSNILAAIGIAQLNVLDERVSRRRTIFEMYRQRLGLTEGIAFMPEADYGLSSRWLTVITIEQHTFGATSDDVRLALQKEGIEARPVWKPLHMQPLFANATCYGGHESEALFNSGLCLPSGSQLTDGQVDLVCDVISNLARA